MVVITKTKLILFYETEPITKEPLLKWYNTVLSCDWCDFSNINKLIIVWIISEMIDTFLMLQEINIEL